MASYNSLKNLQNGKTQKRQNFLPSFPLTPPPPTPPPTHTHPHTPSKFINMLYLTIFMNQLTFYRMELKSAAFVRTLIYICPILDQKYLGKFSPKNFLGKFSPKNQDCFLTMVCDVSKTK